MVLREKVLRKKVEKLELKGLQHNKVIPERLSGLENLLDDVFLTRRPKPSDYDSRRDLVRVFNEIAKELYGDRENCPAVEEFGSFVMDLFSSKSDLDLSVNFSKDAAEFSRDKKIKTLRKFASKFYLLKRKGHVSGVQPILTARVPILKVIDTGTGIECDISVENRDGVLKSQIIHIISSIDERFQKLCFLVKSWASAHGINSSKDRTLNSLSLILLVTFHLQTRNPPILPPFSALFKDGTDPASVVKSVNNFLNCGKGNKESLANLFVTLLIKLSSVEALWSKGLCVSTYQGAWISKTWDSKVGCISVEDFTDRSQNVARAVGMQEAKKINQCIRLSIQHVFDFMNGLIQEPELRGFLFGSDAPIPTPVVDKGPTNRKKPKPKRRKPPTHGRGGMQQATPFNPTLKRGPQVYERIPTVLLGPPVQQVIMPFDPTLTKRMRVNEGWGGNPTETWRATSSGSWGGTQNHQVGWGGMRTVIDAGPVWSNEMQSTGWGGPQQASIPSFGPRLRPAFVPQPDLQLRNINQVIPLPPYVVNPSVDPNLRHGPPPPFNPYGTR